MKTSKTIRCASAIVVAAALGAGALTAAKAAGVVQVRGARTAEVDRRSAATQRRPPAPLLVAPVRSWRATANSGIVTRGLARAA